MTIPALSLAQVPTQGIQIGNAAIPQEGPKALPFLFDFNTATALQVDILFLFQQKLITVLQVLFVDNSQGSGPFKANFSGTGQTIVVPEGAQGYYPILCPVNGKMTVVGSNPVGTPIQVYLINVPMSVLQWEPGGDGFTFSNTGALQTADVALDALIATSPAENVPGLNVNIVSNATGGGGGIAGASYFRSAPVGVGFGQDFGTNQPGGTTKFTLNAMQVYLNPDTYETGGAGVQTINFGWAGAPETTILFIDFWAPAAVAADGRPTLILDVDELEIESAAVSGSFDFTTGGAWTGSGFITRIMGTWS